jgi:hypothetical protein
MRKQIIAVVSSPSGSYLATWSAFSFGGFDKRINGGLGECVLSLPLAFDHAGPDLVLGNNVELRLSDKDTAASGKARTIYRGYISLIERDVSGKAEGITAHLLGDYTRLSLDILRSGSQTTLYSNTASGLTATSASQNAADVAHMARAVIDKYRAATALPRISYALGDAPDAGTSSKYTFQQSTYRDALDKLVAMAPVGTYYYVNEEGRLLFKQQAAAPVHKFILGRHFSELHIEQSLEAVRNVLLLWNGKTDGTSIYNEYEDARSISIYGRRAQSQNIYGIADTGAADNYGARFLGRHKNPDLKVRCTILDNNESELGYDIESINPGDTCSFYGFSASAGVLFQDNMVITSVAYNLDKADIVVEYSSSSIFDVQLQHSRAIGDISTGGLQVPVSYS